MTQLVGLLHAPDSAVILWLLGAGAALHGLALGDERRRWEAVRRGAAALSQGVLIAALGGLTLRLLPHSDPASWWPNRAGDVVAASAWLALLVYLLAGFWWRSPGLGIAAPLLALGLLLLADAVVAAATVTRGLSLELAWRPAFRLIMTGALACTGLASAGIAARWLEAALLGRALLGWPVIAGLITSAALLMTLLVATGGYAWLTRGRGAPLWTVQQTWLVAAWLVLVVAAEASWRRRPLLPALTVVAAAVVTVSVTVVAAIVEGS